MAKPKTVRETLYTTPVLIDSKAYKAVVDQLAENYAQALSEESSTIKSAKQKATVARNFYERNLDGKDQVLFDVSGTVGGHTTRIFYDPSIPGQPREIRDAIVPTQPNNIFIYFDISAADFITACMYAPEVTVLNDYYNGDDIYASYVDLFPEGTDRSMIKNTILSYIYGISPERLSEESGWSKAEANQVLYNLQKQFPKIEAQKRRILSLCNEHNGYVYPKGIDSEAVELLRPLDGPLDISKALNTYTQSALGKWTQRKIIELPTKGTKLCIFDSFCFEINKTKYKPSDIVSMVKETIKPYRTDKIGYGNTFGEAMNYKNYLKWPQQ